MLLVGVSGNWCIRWQCEVAITEDNDSGILGFDTGSTVEKRNL